MLAVSAIAVLALSTFAITPASALSPKSWTLNCEGSGGRASVSWNWLLNGAPVPGAGGSAACADTMTMTGTSAHPPNANGIEVALLVSAGSNDRAKYTTKSFDPGKAFKVQLGASAGDRVCVFFVEPRTCLLWERVDEHARFSLEA